MVSPIFIVAVKSVKKAVLHSNQSGTFWQVEIPVTHFGAQIARLHLPLFAIRLWQKPKSEH